MVFHWIRPLLLLTAQFKQFMTYTVTSEDKPYHQKRADICASVCLPSKWPFSWKTWVPCSVMLLGTTNFWLMSRAFWDTVNRGKNFYTKLTNFELLPARFPVWSISLTTVIWPSFSCPSRIRFSKMSFLEPSRPWHQYLAADYEQLYFLFPANTRVYNQMNSMAQSDEIGVWYCAWSSIVQSKACGP